MKNKTIIDKLVIKYNKGEKLFFDEKFDEYLKNYDINRHNVNTNTKVCFLLIQKIKQEIQNCYDDYITVQMNERDNCTTYEEFGRIKRMAELNIGLRCKIYLDHHEQYKLINIINLKYGREPITKIIKNKCNKNIDIEKKNNTQEEFMKKITYGENGTWYYNI